MNIIKTIAFRLVVIGIALVATLLWPARAEEASISPAEEPPELSEVPALPSPPVAESPTTLKKIAWCESRNRQFNPDGTVLRGVVNPADVGKHQINEKYHLKASQELGMDIHTLEGNTAYAQHLFATQGSKPWDWSKHCWADPNRLWTERDGEYWSE